MKSIEYQVRTADGHTAEYSHSWDAVAHIENAISLGEDEEAMKLWRVTYTKSERQGIEVDEQEIDWREL